MDRDGRPPSVRMFILFVRSFLADFLKPEVQKKFDDLRWF